MTVPALKIDGERVQGSREIARALDRIQPDPPLFPADPDRRAAVEDAERFGDEELQHPIRQLLWWGFKRDKENLRSYSEGAHLGVPIGLAIKTGGPLVALSARFNEATDANARAALAALPDLLDRVDAYIADGTIGGAEPNAADFQIATSIGLALTLDDLKPLIEPRPCRRAGARASSRTTPATPRRSSRRPGCRPRPRPPRPRGPRRSARCSSSGRAARASARTVPSGRVRSGSSSSSGARTKRRLRTSGCGRVRRSVRSSMSPSRSRSTSSGRGLWRGRSNWRPRSASTALQASSSCSGSSAVRIRTAAFRKSGWSRISPTGSVT